MAKTRLFQLEGGSHQEGIGTKVFNKGDYIKSTRDLRKMFPNKFRLIEHDLITQSMLKSIEQEAKSDEDGEEEYVAPAVIKGETEYIGDVSDDEPEVSIDDDLTVGEDEEPEDVEEEEVEERPKKKRRKVARS